MRRLRLATGRGALFGAMLVAALLLLMPMRLALGVAGVSGLGLSARQVSGTVWAGRADEARIGTIAIGDIDLGLSPLALLVGKARMTLAMRGAAPLFGAITITRHSSAVDDLSGHLDGVRLIQLLPAAALDLDGFSARFADGGCAAASGRVRLTLGGSTDGIALPASLTGDARCDGTALLLPLTGPGGASGVTLRLDAGGAYRARIVLPPTDPQVAARLAATGFTAVANGWQLDAQGHL